MDNGRLLKLGLVGSLVTAICCATPLLVIIFGAVGLAAFVGVIDYLLLPLLAVFLGITGFALYQRQRRKHVE